MSVPDPYVSRKNPFILKNRNKSIDMYPVLQYIVSYETHGNHKEKSPENH